MSFQTGLSGLSASSKNLDVIGHNIANANTSGMKASRAEFSEMYASALGATGGSNNGIGVITHFASADRVVVDRSKLARIGQDLFWGLCVRAWIALPLDVFCNSRLR